MFRATTGPASRGSIGPGAFTAPFRRGFSSPAAPRAPVHIPYGRGRGAVHPSGTHRGNWGAWTRSTTLLDQARSSFPGALEASRRKQPGLRV